MLLEFTTKNCLSFKDDAIFSLYASTDISGHELFNLIPAGGTQYILKTAIIYGANASGKTNFIKAMGVFRHIVLKSLKLNEGDEIVSPRDYFSFQLHPQSATAPIEFEISFLHEDI